MPNLADPSSELVIGWKVNQDLEPRYWAEGENAQPGGHKPDDLVHIPSKQVANHTVIVAQSGSGKSFFVGRIIEEILLKTKSRIVVFDPNADFRKISQVRGTKAWKELCKYNSDSGVGDFLVDEYDREQFYKEWKKAPKAILSMKSGNIKHNGIKLQIDWPRISIDILSEGLDVLFESELRHCHEFVRTISDLMFLTGYIRLTYHDARCRNSR